MKFSRRRRCNPGKVAFIWMLVPKALNHGLICRGVYDPHRCLLIKLYYLLSKIAVNYDVNLVWNFGHPFTL